MENPVKSVRLVVSNKGSISFIVFKDETDRNIIFLDFNLGVEERKETLNYKLGPKEELIGFYPNGVSGKSTQLTIFGFITKAYIV